MSMRPLLDSHGVGLFFIYFLTGLVLWVAFNWTYTRLTPYDEAVDIKAGNMAPAISLVGAEIGFMLPLVAASYVTRSWYEFVAWGVVAGIVQLGIFQAMYWRWPKTIESGNCAGALVFAGASIGAGMLNAVSMIP